MSAEVEPKSSNPAWATQPASRGLSGLKADDPGEVVEDLFHWSQRLVGIDGAVFFLVDNDELRASFGFELPTEIVRKMRLPLEKDGPIQDCVIQNATRVLTADIELTAGLNLPWRMAVCIPLAIEANPIGAYVAGWNAPFNIGRDTLLVLEGAASMAASSVHRARLLYQVKREEQQLRALLDGLPIPAVGYSGPELTINYVNAEARGLLGDARGKDVRKTVNAANLSPVDTTTRRDPLEAILSSAGLTRFQMTAIDGSTRIMIPHLAHLGHRGGVIMLVDVTQETNLEIQRKRFVRMISHHLRSPLTPLMGYADIIGGTSEEAAVQEAASEIGAAVKEITDQIERLEQIADLQPLDEGSLRSTEVRTAILSAWESANGMADELSLDGDVDLHVICHPDYVIKATAEIFTNAYTHGRPPVEVRVGATKEEVVITCKDSGGGISPEWESAVFAPYLTAQGGYEAPAAGQLGLGLTLARALIEATLGRLTYQDGSFEIRLRRDVASISEV